MNVMQQLALEAEIAKHRIHPLDAIGLIDAVLDGVRRGYGLTARVQECADTLRIALDKMPLSRTTYDDEDDAAGRAREAGL
ncbi:MAG: hypothetical protein ACYDBH_24425 [Acidobacteriaceae bacterium]